MRVVLFALGKRRRFYPTFGVRRFVVAVFSVVDGVQLFVSAAGEKGPVGHANGHVCWVRGAN